MSNSQPLDLGVLVDLDALLIHGSVSAAARSRGITQSAMSQRLKRLRETLGDPLFISGRGGLIPTERALAMAAPLREALADLAKVPEVGRSFDPLSSTRHFVVATADIGEFIAVPPVMKRMEVEAPKVTLSTRHPGPNAAQLLESGEIDLVVGESNLEGANLMQKSLGVGRFAVVCRVGHPVIKEGYSMEDYLKVNHLLISQSGHRRGLTDQLLSKEGLKRHIRATVGHLVPAPFMVARSDLVLTCPRSLAIAAQAYIPLQVLPAPPLPYDREVVKMVWHRRNQRDPGHIWLRQLTGDVTIGSFDDLGVSGAEERGRELVQGRVGKPLTPGQEGPPRPPKSPQGP